MQIPSVSDLFRYLSVGVVAIVVASIVEPKGVSPLVKDNPVRSLVSAWVIGGLIYAIYRPFIYWGFVYLKNRRLFKSNNPRSYLQDMIRMSGREAEQYWGYLRTKWLADATAMMRTDASGIHLLYQSSVIFFAGFGYSVINLGIACWTTSLMLLISLLLGVLALYSDIQFEESEYRMLRTIKTQTIISIAEVMGYEIIQSEG